MHTDTVITSTPVSVSTPSVSDLARALDEHHMTLPAGDPAEPASERACEFVGTIARYAAAWSASMVADASGYLDGTRPVGRALAPSPILGRYRSGQSDAGPAVVALCNLIQHALCVAELLDVDDECDARYDAGLLRGWLAEVELALPARTLVAECRTAEQAERALRAAVAPFGSLDADMVPMILAAAAHEWGALDALDAALAEADGEPSELAIIPRPRSGVGAWGTGVVTPTSGTLILVSRTHSGDYRVSVDFPPHPLDARRGAQGRPMAIRGADTSVTWTTIGGAS